MPDFHIRVTRQGDAAFLPLAIGAADLHEPGVGGDGLGDVRIYLGL
jgi:hypothetical protein